MPPELSQETLAPQHETHAGLENGRNQTHGAWMHQGRGKMMSTEVDNQQPRQTVRWARIWTGSPLFGDSPGHLRYLSSQEACLEGLRDPTHVAEPVVSVQVSCHSSGPFLARGWGCQGGLWYITLVPGPTSFPGDSCKRRVKGAQAGAFPGHPLHPFRSHLPGGASYLGSAAIRVSKVREGHGGCPRPASLFCLFPPQPPRFCVSSRVQPRLLTRLRVPSAGPSARLALLDAEPRAARLPSPAL